MRSMMRVPVLLGSVALLLIAVAAVVFISGDTALGREDDPVVVDDGKQIESTTNISVEEAVTIALNHANGKVDDVDIKQRGSDVFYDIEVGDTDVLINATDGSVIRIDRDDDDDDDKRGDTSSGKASQFGNIISTDEAIAIARTVASGDVREIELDEDDGRLEYEIEIGNYDVEIDAHTGEILDVDHDD